MAQIPSDIFDGERHTSMAGTLGSTSDEVVYRVSALDILAVMLLLFGAMNWGFVALFGVDPISSAFGANSSFTHCVQILIALSSIYAVATFFAAARRPVQIRD